MESKARNDFSNDLNVDHFYDMKNQTIDSLDDFSVDDNNYYNIKSDSNNNKSNDVIVYETNAEDMSFSDNCYDYKAIDDLDVRELERKLKTLSADNAKLSQELMASEEQIIDLMSERQSLQKSLKSQTDCFKQKIDSYINCVEDMKQNVIHLETFNERLEEKLNQKSKEYKDLKISFEDIGDKLLYSEFQLREAKKKESELKLSLTATEEALSIEKCEKHEIIERLDHLYNDCNERDKYITDINSEMDSMKQQIVDKENELSFYRSGDQTPIGHDFESDTKRASNASSSVNRKSKPSKTSDKSTIFRDSSSVNQMEEHLYEKVSHYNKNDNLCYEDKNNCEIQTNVNSDDDTKVLKSSKKSLVFPSLPDVILRKLQLLRENCCSIESLTEQEIESKFTTLSLSFKTDKTSLDQRLKLEKHRRDVAELDANNELQSLRESVQQLNQLIYSFDDFIISNIRSEMIELVNTIETQVEVVGKTSSKISSRSELYGAVKQEERMSSAFDVILLHSENVKRERERDRKELEKTKKRLNSGHKKNDFESDSDSESVPIRRSIRSISTTVIPKMNLIRIRRSSVSSLEILPNLDSNRKTIHNNTNSRYVVSIPSRSRRSSMPVFNASSLVYKSRAGAEDGSQLEITTEERCGSETDSVSSLPNRESDDERNANSLGNKLSEEEINSSSHSWEQNNNILNAVNNNEDNDNGMTETFSQNISQNSDETNLSDNEIKSKENNYLNKNNNKIINFIDCQLLLNLFNYCFDERIGGYMRRKIKNFKVFFAVILLIISLFIVIWSVLQIRLPSLPCHCECDSWQQFFSKILVFNERFDYKH